MARAFWKGSDSALVARKVKSGDTHAIVEPDASAANERPAKEVVDLKPLLELSLERAGKSAGMVRRAARPAPHRRSA